VSQTQIDVPDLGGMEEVEVIEICVQPGDSVGEEESLVVLEGDKASMEVPSPVAGVVHTLLVKVGDKVSTDSPLVLMDVQGPAEESDSEPPKPIKDESPLPVQSVQADDSSTKGGGVTIIDVRVPDLGGLDSVEIIELSAAIGDELQAEESLMVLESDKASMEIPVEKAGTLMSFTVKLGDKVSEGDVIATMQVVAASASSAEPQSAVPQSSASLASAVPVTKAPVDVNVAAASAPTNPNAAVHTGPAVRKLAREMGIDLTQVLGTGPKTRILKEDLLGFVKQKVNSVNQAVTTAVGIKGSSEDFSRFGGISEQPLSKIKQITAKNMVASWTTIPQVTQFDEADITDLEIYRKGDMQSQLPEGVKVSPLAFILKACAKALQKYPQFNASLGPNGDTLVLKEFYNLSVAVDTPDGLMVPVIKQAETKGVVDLARESSGLAKLARDKKLPMDAMMGASFTISSLGGIGGTAFTPIVNAPQVAILGVSKATYKPVWNGSSFEPRLMLPLCVSYDHRVIDGAQAALFTRYLCQLLSDVRHLLL
jgi:pyruvate dehydrogenase E2 component (dihydrolipoamide acetyltransferase)